MSSSNIIEDVVLGIFRSGTNQSTFQVLNYILLALITAILLLYSSGAASIHFMVLLFLAVGLLLSINWFYALLEFQNLPNDALEATTASATNIVKKKVVARSRKNNLDK